MLNEKEYEIQDLIVSNKDLAERLKALKKTKNPELKRLLDPKITDLEMALAKNSYKRQNLESPM